MDGIDKKPFRTTLTVLSDYSTTTARRHLINRQLQRVARGTSRQAVTWRPCSSRERVPPALVRVFGTDFCWARSERD
jgi:hypothetical protein